MRIASFTGHISSSSRKFNFQSRYFVIERIRRASERARGKEDSSCISIYVQISRVGCFFSFFFFPRNVTMEITDTTEKRGARVTRCKIENSYVSLSIILFHRPGGWSVSFLPLPHILRNRVISSRLIPRFQTRQCY